MNRLLSGFLAISLLIGLLVPPALSQGGGRLDHALPTDARLGPPKTLDDYFPFSPPTTKEQWEKRRQEVKEQVLVANGLWPMPHKTPLNPVIHGKTVRDGYTVEKVYFASYPGFYVTGSLYRPTGIGGKKVPGVLCPHGHWANGRFYEAGAAEIERQLKNGAEKTREGAMYPLQARCANLAMLGCVVFHYDMVGYADSKQIAHREGFKDVQAELWQQSFMGLQTWDSIRALDFLISLPEVDPQRIGVTGASGGGTQTFILCAVDDRPAVAFPAVMVSTAMQGGCVCENCSYLRVGTGNIELAGLFAPRPLGMSEAKDWTWEIETKGLPQLKTLYKLYGAEDKVKAQAWLQFPHNYNQVAREFMYNWFNKHLKLGHSEPIVEKAFVPVPPRELSVWDEKHSLPGDAKGAEELRLYLTEQARRQLKEMFPRDIGKLNELRRIVGPALRAMMSDSLPSASEVTATGLDRSAKDDFILREYVLSRKGQREAVPAVEVRGKEFDGTVVVWIHPSGRSALLEDGKLCTPARRILDSHGAVLAPDLFWTGELRPLAVQLRVDATKLKELQLTLDDVRKGLAAAGVPTTSTGNTLLVVRPMNAKWTADSLLNIPITARLVKTPVALRNIATAQVVKRLPVDPNYAGFTFGYNRTVLANRVHDILTVIAFARSDPAVKKVHLVGIGEAGPWVLLARALCGYEVDRTAVDMNQFRFDTILNVNDPMMQPGALKYGGLPAFTALNAPHALFLHNTRNADPDGWIAAAYEAAGQPWRLHEQADPATAEQVITWLLQ